MKKILTVGAIFALALGLASCDKDKTEPQPPVEGSTYVSVSLNIPAGLRALPTDYNHVGEWVGKDVIKSVAVYVVDGSTVSTGEYAIGDFDITTTDASGINTPYLTPKKGIKTTAGEKTVYVLINGTPEVVKALAQADAAKFATAFKETALQLANTKAAKTEVSTSASKIAKVTATEDEIVMTNDVECKITVEEGVTEPQTLDKSAPQNRAKVTVSRAVARVMVTSKEDTYVVKSTSGEKLGTVSDIKWVLAQGENSLYIQRNAKYRTPKYDFKPQKTDYYTTKDNGYDYSGLWEDFSEDDAINGTKVPPLSAYTALNTDKNNKAAVLASLGLDENAVNGKFILPTTHPFGDKDKTGYTKGNTPYVLVRAKFTPAKLADGVVYKDGDDFYLGDNGLFYSSNENAKDPDKGGVVGQKSTKYVGGKVLYFAWVNPDDILAPYNSPVVRNNIYHIHIKGFKTIGTNWNPLVPGDDPTKPEDDPNNPDPKPNNPDEPGDNPIHPEDPLTTPETWMSVEIKVLPWKIQSYSIDLKI
ncbi:Minor fimbrium subunit Mfa1 [Porphyromonas levii]|uniref:Mfa1 family fimbria major subunit n=1 Tax=Porphyromonas levii TaxID=28114 RepID=UPI001B8AF50C|nr:Mfa1 family fimbria major subunit [Porphyromonas levii]MBR8732414.1 Minor fimbrium subunit Mfa1 [Porphyromonas levii]